MRLVTGDRREVESASDRFLRGYGREHLLCPDTHIRRCPWCRRKRGLTHVEFYGIAEFDRERRGYRLVYPRIDLLTVAVVSHPECGPDTGYPFRLDDLASEPIRWYEHLRAKVWAPSCLKDLIRDLLLLHRRDAYPRFSTRGSHG